LSDYKLFAATGAEIAPGRHAKSALRTDTFQFLRFFFPSKDHIE